MFNIRRSTFDVRHSMLDSHGCCLTYHGFYLMLILSVIMFCVAVCGAVVNVSNWLDLMDAFEPSVDCGATGSVLNAGMT